MIRKNKDGTRCIRTWKQLRKKEEQLRDKEKQLREEMLAEKKQQQGKT